MVRVLPINFPIYHEALGALGVCNQWFTNVALGLGNPILDVHPEVHHPTIRLLLLGLEHLMLLLAFGMSPLLGMNHDLTQMMVGC
jgi:hypothetical protein